MKRKLPFLVGLVVLLVYSGWMVLHTGTASADDWGSVAEPVADRLRAFLTGGEFWMGASYALSAGFTIFALSVFRENRKRAAVGAAGGVAVAGVVYGLGCFFLGCCGSPMLPIYIGLLGGKWAKISGPLMFCVTLASVAWGVRMLRRKRECCCEGTCDESANG